MVSTSVALLMLGPTATAAFADSITETVQIGKPISLPWPSTLAFRPAASRAAPSAWSPRRGSLTPDVAGEYVLDRALPSGTKQTLRYQAVALEKWSLGAGPLMRDEFVGGAHSTKVEDSDTGRNFWQLLPTHGAGCAARKTGGRLTITAAAATTTASCGLRTREPCPRGGAAMGCGFASGLSTVNPFADRILCGQCCCCCCC